MALVRKAALASARRRRRPPPAGGGGAAGGGGGIIQEGTQEFNINGIRCKMLGVFRNIDSLEFGSSLDEKKKLRIIFMVYLDQGYPTLTGEIRNWLPYYISSGSKGGSGSQGKNFANPFFGIIRPTLTDDPKLQKTSLVGIHHWDTDEAVVNGWDKHYAKELLKHGNSSAALPTPLSILRYPIYKILKDNDGGGEEHGGGGRNNKNNKPEYRFIRRLLYPNLSPSNPNYIEDDLYLDLWFMKCGLFTPSRYEIDRAVMEIGKVVGQYNMVPQFKNLITNLTKVSQFFYIDPTVPRRLCNKKFVQIDQSLRSAGNWDYTPFDIQKQEQEYMVHIPTITGEISISLPLLNEFTLDDALGDNTPFGVNLTSIYNPQQEEYKEFLKVYSEFIPEGIGEDYIIQKALRLSVPTLIDILLSIIGINEPQKDQMYHAMYKKNYPDTPTAIQQTALTKIAAIERPPPPSQTAKTQEYYKYRLKHIPTVRWEKNRIAGETPQRASGTAGGGGARWLLSLLMLFVVWL